MSHSTNSSARNASVQTKRWRAIPCACGLIAAATLALIGGCSSTQHADASMDHSNAPRATPSTAVGMMPMGHARLLTADGAPAGTAKMQSVLGGVEIVLEVQGMAPGTHGFHIHANGECAPALDAKTGKMVAFSAAGGHFDPYNTQTHGQPGQSPKEIHAGDTPNLVVDASGRGTLRYTNTFVTLTPGPNSIAGRSLVVHEKQDDYKTNPAGDSGARIACGVILITPADRADAASPSTRPLGT